MTYKDIYQLPLHKPKYGSWVYDEKSNFVFQFERQYDEKGDYAEGWLEFEDKIINKLSLIPNLAKMLLQEVRFFTGIVLK